MQWFWTLVDAGRRFAPHGYCMFWEPELVWTHVIADGLIAFAYFSIPVALIHFFRRRQDFQFSYVLLLFAVFIIACGTSHLMSIWTIWHADYGWEALIKVITALSSVATAVVLWKLMPKLLEIPSAEQLRQRNSQLEQALASLTAETQERERAEEALRQAQKMEAVGQLTGGIAHDFNNLLQAVSGSLELIAGDPQSAKVPRWAAMGRQAAERGARLTSQLLTFSRMQKLRLRPCEVAPLVLGMRDLLASAVGAAIRLDLDLAGPDHMLVMADPTQIELAIMNLAINARDAMPDGGTIRITTRALVLADDADLADGAYLEICVADTGAGMPDDVRQRAFEPFFTTKDVGKGTGLGLSMVYGMARQSGGRAQIRSASGEGTTVSILLRIVEGDAEKALARNASSAICTQSLTILLVDDDPDALETAEALIQSLGHGIWTAPGADAALALLESMVPDLVILDYAMPGINGARLAGMMRDRGMAAPIIFATGFADLQAIQEATGLAAVLAKPYSRDDLAGVIAATMAFPTP